MALARVKHRRSSDAVPLKILHSNWPDAHHSMHMFSSQRYYLKKMMTSKQSHSPDLSNGLRMEAVKEIGILRALNSEHVISLACISIREGWDNETDDNKTLHLGKKYERLPEAKDSYITLVFPRMRCNLKEYFDRIFKDKSGGSVYPFGPEIIRSYAAQLLLALEHCHRRGVVHRDVRPEKILLSDEGGLLKLGGFGW